MTFGNNRERNVVRFEAAVSVGLTQEIQTRDGCEETMFGGLNVVIFCTQILAMAGVAMVIWLSRYLKKAKPGLTRVAIVRH